MAKQIKEKINNKEVKIPYNNEIITEIQPQGGISFTDEKLIKTGDGFVACLHITKYPKQVDRHWLHVVTNIANSIVTIDVTTGSKIEVQKNINKSIHDQRNKRTGTKDNITIKKSVINEQALDQLAEQIELMDETVKLITIRIYLSSHSPEDLYTQINDIRDYLKTNAYEAYVLVDETKNEWLSMQLPYKEQAKDLSEELKRNGQPVTASSLAKGNPFHFTKLSDPSGFYYGTTQLGGSVFFDQFHKDQRRASYNMVIVGKTGSGKSTLLKKMLEDNAIKGNYVRGFDGTGEYKEITKAYGGQYISLDGTNNVINPLEIYKTAEEEKISYSRHLSKAATIFAFLAPEATQYELMEFENILTKTYIEHGIIPLEFEKKRDIQCTGRKSEEYPIFSDVLKTLREELYEDYLNKIIRRTNTSDKTSRLERIELTLDNIISNYGDMFNHKTSIDDLQDEQIVYFDIKNILNLKSSVFNALLFMAITLCWDNCFKVGMKQKELYENNEILWDDIQRFIIQIDEAHRIVNTQNISCVNQLLTFEREDRKYFGGLQLASQSVRDFIVDESSTEGMSQIMALFEQTQYKIILQQDSGTLGSLEKIFRNSITQTEIDNIPKFQQGECLLAISGDKTIQFHIDINQRQNQLFKGGA